MKHRTPWSITLYDINTIPWNVFTIFWSLKVNLCWRLIAFQCSHTWDRKIRIKWKIKNEKKKKEVKEKFARRSVNQLKINVWMFEILMNSYNICECMLWCAKGKFNYFSSISALNLQNFK